jgi:hypothetical protein
MLQIQRIGVVINPMNTHIKTTEHKYATMNAKFLRTGEIDQFRGRCTPGLCQGTTSVVPLGNLVYCHSEPARASFASEGEARNLGVVWRDHKETAENVAFRPNPKIPRLALGS